jgi:hypothetical protein
MFITAGDQGTGENTIHMVLARPEGGAPGSPGIGLYIVPKFWVNDDGSLGEPNDVTTVGVEHKMGLHAQATALLNFGDEDCCRGILVGPPPNEKGQSQGLAMMFHMMNESRIGTVTTPTARLPPPIISPPSTPRSASRDVPSASREQTGPHHQARRHPAHATGHEGHRGRHTGHDLQGLLLCV